MDDQTNLKIGRRDIFRMLALGAVAAATSETTSVEAADFPDTRTARYHADAREVQTFYRVNRYPDKAGR
jgi:hypothetical protein